MAQIHVPIIVVAYADDVRKSLVASLEAQQLAAVSCATFREAEDTALQGLFCGMLVDLTSMIKAKGEEKVIAYSLTGFYPTLRVRAMGSMLIPMIMPGGARQDSSLADFLNKSCSAFLPRRLRACRRHEMCIPAIVRPGPDQHRSFIQNLSYGGAFIADLNPENYAVGDQLTVSLPEFSLEVQVVVIWTQPWGLRKMSGFGVSFSTTDDRFGETLAGLIRINKDHDRDRMVA